MGILGSTSMPHQTLMLRLPLTDKGPAQMSEPFKALTSLRELRCSTTGKHAGSAACPRRICLLCRRKGYGISPRYPSKTSEVGPTVTTVVTIAAMDVARHLTHAVESGNRITI